MSHHNEKIALGQTLFFDGRLSADGTMACRTSRRSPGSEPGERRDDTSGHGVTVTWVPEARQLLASLVSGTPFVASAHATTK